MKKKKKIGFTLVELLGVIVVLGIVVSITIITITSVMNNSKKKTYVLTENNILTTALTYAKENNNKFYNDSSNNREYQCITIQELIELGYLRKDVAESKILDGETPINVKENMVAFIERTMDSKVFNEGHLIKNSTDEINQYCYFVDDLKCPGTRPYNGTFDNREHTISLFNVEEDLILSYRTGTSNPWTTELPKRVNAGTTYITYQVTDSEGHYKYCGTSSININKQEVTKPECRKKSYNGQTQVLFEANSQQESITRGYFNDILEGKNADTYKVLIKLDSNYKWRDGYEKDYELSCEINRKKISVKWTNETFTYNGTPQGPTPSVETGIEGETIVLTAEKYTTVGSHTSTATCNEGASSCYNYELDNIQKTFYIQAAPSSSSPSSSSSSPSSSSTKTYSIFYQDYDGSYCGKDTQNAGTQVTINASCDALPGFNFIGWSTSYGGTSVNYTNGQQITLNESITLYAVWKKSETRTLYFSAPKNNYTRTCNVTAYNGDSLGNCSVIAPSICGSDTWTYSSYSYTAGNSISVTSALNEKTFTATLAPVKTKTQYRSRECTSYTYGNWSKSSYVVNYNCSEPGNYAGYKNITKSYAENYNYAFYWSCGTTGDMNECSCTQYVRSITGCKSWGEWSDWSDTKITATTILDVETRTIDTDECK